MIKPPSKRVLESLSSLEYDPRFVEVMQWLRESRDHTIEQCIHESEGARMRQLQGASVDLAEIIKRAEEARETINSIRKQ